jgi:hypothetical protein
VRRRAVHRQSVRHRDEIQALERKRELAERAGALNNDARDRGL